MASLIARLRRFPVTMLLALAISTVAILTNTHVTGIQDATLANFGHAPFHLQTPGEWFRLATAVFLTVGGGQFWASLAMLLLAVGGWEYVRGSKAAAAIFFGVHVVTMLSEYALIAFPLSYFGFAAVDVLHTSLDVGPSAGYYGCLGALVGGWNHPVRRSMTLGVIILLTVRLAASLTWTSGSSTTLSADVAHLLAFPLGWLASAFFRPNEPSNRADVSCAMTSND